NRSLDAHAAVVPAVGGLHACYAAEADADAAGHRRFQRDVTGYAPARRQLRQSVQHRLRTAADELRRRRVRFEQLRDETVVAEAAVVAGKVDGRTGCAKILDAGRKVGRANAVVQRDALNHPPRRPAAVAARAEQAADVGEERRLADAARD